LESVDRGTDSLSRFKTVEAVYSLEAEATKDNRKRLLTSTTVVYSQCSVLSENRIVLYKKGKQTRTGYFIIEISSTLDHVFIVAFNVEMPQALIIQMNEKQAKSILDMFGHDFDVLASWLNVEHGRRLVLMNPLYRPQSVKKEQSSVKPKLFEPQRDARTLMDTRTLPPSSSVQTPQQARLRGVFASGSKRPKLRVSTQIIKHNSLQMEPKLGQGGQKFKFPQSLNDPSPTLVNI
jgi:hypothetical protein